LFVFLHAKRSFTMRQDSFEIYCCCPPTVKFTFLVIQGLCKRFVCCLSLGESVLLLGQVNFRNCGVDTEKLQKSREITILFTKCFN